MYKFATEPVEQPGAVYHNGLSDDRKTTTYVLDTPNSGLAYSFRIIGEESNDSKTDSYISQQGYLDSFRILVKPEGEPGKLNCYIIDKADLAKFQNPAQFEDMYNAEDSEIRFFAKASTNYSGSNNKQYVTFNFEKEGVYPLMSRDDDYEDEKVEYVAIITADGVNKPVSGVRANRYYIICLQKDNSENEEDLEVNYKLYDYVAKDADATEVAITDTDNTKDLFFQIVTRAVVENEPYPLSQGLYTAHYHNQNIKTGLSGQTARVMLRIKREGKYITNVTSDEPSIYLSSQTLPVVSDDEENIVDLDDIHFDTKDFYVDLQCRGYEETGSENYVPVVVGNNITTITNCDPKSPKNITTGNPVMIDNEDKICRVGYNVAIKARVINFNKETGAYSASNYDRYVMPLTAVCKDFDPTTNEYSDRLIFEAELDAKDTEEDGTEIFKKYNDFELQLYWEHNRIARAANFDTDIAVRRRMTGAIKDIVLSIDRNF